MSDTETLHAHIDRLESMRDQLKAELAAVRKERDALTAALVKLDKMLQLTSEINPSLKQLLGITADPKAILDAHDAAKDKQIAALSAAIGDFARECELADQQAADGNDTGANERRRGAEDRLRADKPRAEDALKVHDAARDQVWINALDSVKREMDQGKHFENPFLAVASRAALAPYKEAHDAPKG